MDPQQSFSFRPDSPVRTNRNQRHRDPGAPVDAPRAPLDRSRLVRIIAILFAAIVLVSVVALAVSAGLKKSAQQAEEARLEEQVTSEVPAAFEKYLFYLAYGARDDSNADVSIAKIMKNYNKYGADLFIEKKIAEANPDGNSEYFSSLNELYNRFADPYTEYLNSKIIINEEPDTADDDDDDSDDTAASNSNSGSNIVYVDDDTAAAEDATDSGEPAPVVVNPNLEYEQQLNMLALVRTYFYDYATLPVLSAEQITQYFLDNGADNTREYINNRIRTSSADLDFQNYVELKNIQANAIVTILDEADTAGCEIKPDSLTGCNPEALPSWDTVSDTNIKTELDANWILAKIHKSAVFGLGSLYKSLVSEGVEE